jgi:hypothetical protein
MDIQGYRATPEDVNTRKCVRACARGIVYTSKKDPRALALHLLHPQLRVVLVEVPRLTPRQVSGIGRQGLRQRGRTPARTRLDLPVKSSSTVRESVRLRPSPRFLRSRKNGPSNKRVTKCTENPYLVPGYGTVPQGAVKKARRASLKTTSPSFGKDISRFWGSKPHDGL